MASRCVIVLRILWPTGVSLSSENCGQQVCHCPEGIALCRCQELYAEGKNRSSGLSFIDIIIIYG